MKKVFFFFLIGIGAVTWAMNRNAQDAGEKAMAVFLMSEKGETCIQVHAGEEFALKFLTSPGTGYSWEFAVKPDGSLLEFIEARAEETEKPRLGGSEFAVWTFRALAAGEADISLKYVRPWEKDADPARKHVFKVHIR